MTTYASKTQVKLTRKQDVEAMLRDIALVMRLTQKVKASILADQAMPTGGRFAECEGNNEQVAEFAMV